ncbi:MAG: PfkB family carbohydrate kinase [Roseibium sp.]
MLQKDDTSLILCAGRIYCDLVFTDVPRMPTLGTETFAGSVSLHAGGGAFNSAVAFQALGKPAALLGTLPSAPFDGPILKEALTAGVDLSLCAQAEDGAAPQITVAMALQNDRSFLSHTSGLACPPLDLSAPACRAIRHLHIGELKSLSETPVLLDQARNAGWTVSLDCGWNDELMKRGHDMATLISKVDVFLPNESEFAALTASGLPQDCSKMTVIKCGSSGARAYADGVLIDCPAAAVDVVDATGAGDAFNSGFLAAWLDGATLMMCLESGNRSGASAVQSVGNAIALV